MTSRKKPGVAFWASVVVVAVLLYVASVGPALWLIESTGRRKGLVRALNAIYWPVGAAHPYYPRWFNGRYAEYLEWWPRRAR